jgi:hypothetical protein
VSNYAAADRSHWYQDTPGLGGSVINPNVVVLHTTETTSLPDYEGGATAPTYTAVPDFAAKRLQWFAHFPDERSSRALRNEPGGVETNTLNAVQVELVGTCDPAAHKRWGSHPHIFWPDAPYWALRELALFLVDMHKRHGLRLEAPKFLPYPASYGASAVRFTYAQWRAFYGVCGHQHVPENVHGDPGDIDVDKLLKIARRKAGLNDPHWVPAPHTDGGRHLPAGK